MPKLRVCPALCRHATYVIAGLLVVGSTNAIAAGNAENGERAFRLCAACHSLEPDRHKTEPSLAGVLGRKAGAKEGFHRYSPALKGADVVWNETTLDAWITDPQAFLPGNRMIFRGLPDAQARADLIAYLVQAGGETAGVPKGGMMGMGGDELPDLKILGAEHQVTAVRYCQDTYEVTTAAGASEPYWETNLRFKTDSGKPAPTQASQ